MSSFTIEYSTVVNKIVTNKILLTNNNIEKNNAIALWDTGATCSCISRRIIKQLTLTPISKTRILTPSGTKVFNQYYLNIRLPNGVLIRNCVACESEIDKQGLDIIIGMDIISRGDFAITNKKTTKFSYRIPSSLDIDFVRDDKKTKLNN